LIIIIIIIIIHVWVALCLVYRVAYKYFSYIIYSWH
jgi:hypothetical protein